jgi:hypothetical protein
MVKEGSMKAIIGGAAGVAALGGALLLANTRSTSTAVQPQNPAATVASTSAQAQVGPLYVDCGDGRMALIRPAAPGQQFSYVECTPAPVAVAPQGYATGYAAGYGQPAGYMMAAGAYPAVQVQQPVQERVVYVDRPVTRTVTRSRPAYRRTASYAPARSTYEVRQGRSWKKSALIIGGSAAAGAGVGAILDGKSGAKKGAIVGGVGGLVYDLATRNK